MRSLDSLLMPGRMEAICKQKRNIVGFRKVSVDGVMDGLDGERLDELG